MQFFSLFLVAGPNKNRAVVRSQTQGWVSLQLVLNLLQNLNPLATKRKLKKIEGEMKCFFQFQREQRELDRHHESRMMQLIMTMQQQQKQLLISPPVPLAPQHRYDNAASTLPSRHFQNLLPPPPTCPWCTKILIASDACIITTWIVWLLQALEYSPWKFGESSASSFLKKYR